MPVSYTVRSYAELERWADAYTSPGGLRLLFVVGQPGSAKSATFKARVRGAAHAYIKAARLTAFQLYGLLHTHRDRALILDDVEDAIRRHDTARLLMALCETDDGARPVAWFGKAIDGVPTEFRTTSRVCVICNEWRLLSKRFEALLDRGIVVKFDPPHEEIHRYAGEWFDDREIYQFVEDHLGDIRQHSCRFYVNARDLKGKRLDWRAALLESWAAAAPKANETEAAVAALVRDSRFRTEAERVAAFVAAGRSRRTYFYVKRALGL